MTGNGHRGLRILVAVGLVIDLCLMGYLIYLLWGQPPAPSQAGALTVDTPADMWSAYQAALAAAQTEAADALPLAASTQWEGASEEKLLAETGRWSFVFYSPTQSQSFDVIVGQTGGQVVNRVQVWETPTTLRSGKWQAGPREPMLIFLAYGGRDFLAQHPGALVDLHLGMSESGRTAWNIIALDVTNGESFSTLIDAETMIDLLGGGVQ